MMLVLTVAIADMPFYATATKMRSNKAEKMSRG